MRTYESLVFGSTGFLGSNLRDYLHSIDHQVASASRRKVVGGNLEFHIDHQENMEKIFGKATFKNVFLLSGYYSPKDVYSEWNNVIKSNFLIQKKVIDYFAHQSTNIILVGSYFEKCPENMKPWSFYSWVKSALRNYSEQVSQRRSTAAKITYVYIYDTYGDTFNRGKIFDQFARSDVTGEKIKCSPGGQMLNFTHVHDVARALHHINSLDITSKFSEFQLKSRDNVTLLDLKQLFARNPLSKINVEFGAKRYRDKEVFEVWDCAPDIPNFKHERNLIEFIVQLQSRRFLRSSSTVRM